MKKTVLLSLLMSLCIALPTYAKGKQSINVMSFNIRLNTTVDGDNQWTYRKDLAANLVKFYDTDIFGAQEVLHEQLTDFLDRLPNFDYVGVGRADGKTKGEYAPIFYNKDRFKVIKSGDFWLAENPDQVGVKGWDAACERVATWAILQDKKSKKKLFFFNTHLDHMGKEARHEGAKLVLKKVTELADGLPIIVTGDFNATKEEDPIQVLINPSDPAHLIDSRTVSDLVYGPEWSFHNFGRSPLNKRSIIDYIFIKGNITVKKHAVLAESVGELYPSDHCPVFATIEL